MTGSGTLLDPYIIYDVDDLQAMGDHLDAYYELGNDIDASATIGWHGGAGFIPVGTNVNPFIGHFDGKNYTISELFINRPATDFIGLFGYAIGATIQNVNLESANITGFSSVGALVGYMDSGLVENASSSGTVTANDAYVGGLGGELEGTTVRNCHSSCTVAGVDPLNSVCAGGLIGTIQAGATIEQCYATGDVTAAAHDAGGLIGTAGDSTVSKCFATGNAESIDANGGLIGFNDGAIQNCYARGNATSTANRAGGLIGHNGLGTVSNCYSTGIATSPAQVGGLIGQNDMALADISNCFWDTDTSGTLISDGGTGLTTAQMKTEATFTGAGWNFVTIWDITPAINDGYPYLPSVVLATVTTNPASAISHLSAILNGILADDGGEACECGFQWGLTDSYGMGTPTQSLVTGESFSQAIHGLFPGTTYHFRAFATNSAGTGYGDDRSFTSTPTFNRAHALSREEL